MTMTAMTGILPMGATPPATTVDGLSGNPRTHASDAAAAIREPGSPTLIDREAFLKLLVAQLKYQDPSKPIDSSELISQSAQLSVVDKLSEIASMLKSSAATEQLMVAGSVVGKDVSFYGPDGVPMTGTVSHVMFEAGEMTLGVGEWDVPFDAVLAIFDRPAAPAAPHPSSPSSGPAPADPTPAAPPVDPETATDPYDLPAPTGADAVADPDHPDSDATTEETSS